MKRSILPGKTCIIIPQILIIISFSVKEIGSNDIFDISKAQNESFFTCPKDTAMMKTPLYKENNLFRSPSVVSKSKSSSVRDTEQLQCETTENEYSNETEMMESNGTYKNNLHPNDAAAVFASGPTSKSRISYDKTRAFSILEGHNESPSTCPKPETRTLETQWFNEIFLRKYKCGANEYQDSNNSSMELHKLHTGDSSYPNGSLEYPDATGSTETTNSVSTNIRVERGRQLNIWCTAENNEIMGTLWYKGSIPLDMIYFHDENGTRGLLDGVKVPYNITKSGNLVINNVSSQHDGPYTCFDFYKNGRFRGRIVTVLTMSGVITDVLWMYAVICMIVCFSGLVVLVVLWKNKGSVYKKERVLKSPATRTTSLPGKQRIIFHSKQNKSSDHPETLQWVESKSGTNSKVS